MAPTPMSWTDLNGHSSLDDAAYLKAFHKSPKRAGDGTLPSIRASYPSISSATVLPAGFPPSLNSPLAWAPSELQHAGPTTLELTPADLSEVRTALSHFKGMDQFIQ